MKVPHVSVDNGSVLLEWIKKDSRFMIGVEKDSEESFWSYVNTNGTDASGYFPAEMLAWLAKFQTE